MFNLKSFFVLTHDTCLSNPPHVMDFDKFWKKLKKIYINIVLLSLNFFYLFYFILFNVYISL